MNLEKLGTSKLKPTRDLVAFTWIPQRKTKEGILLPEGMYDLGLRLGQFYIGKVLAAGPKVSGLKSNDKILVHEYGIIDFRGTWKEGEIYFIEEKNIKGTVTGIRDLILRNTSGKEE